MDNKFGAVLGDRVVFNIRKVWFGGSVREDFPVRHITSVRHEVKRRPVWGVVLTLFGLGMLGAKTLVLALIVLGLAVLCFLGRHQVTIHTSGGQSRTSIGTPFDKAEAETYATAVREALFVAD